MTNYAKVKEYTNLVRDMNSKAILNIDEQMLKEHRRKKLFAKQMMENSDKINKLENDITEIKDMLSFLINRK